MRIVAESNQRLVRAMFGVFADEGATNHALDRLGLALDGAVEAAAAEYREAIANSLFWAEMKPASATEIGAGWSEKDIDYYSAKWKKDGASALRSLGALMSFQHEIDQFN